MASPAILAVRIVSEATRAIAGFQDTETAAQRWQRRVTTASTVAGVAVVAFARQAAAAASSQQQAFGAVESVYGDAADQVKALARDAASSVGLAASEYAQFAAVLGSQLGNLGVAQEDLIGTQDQLIRTASDLAATFGGTTAEAVEALSSLFRGETDPIERYGVTIKEADVNARLAAQGMEDLTGAARTQAETQARLALVTEQSTAAQGAFAREADTAAGAQQRANAAWENAQATLGEALLPIITQVTQVLTQLATWVGENTGLVTALGLALGTLAVTMRIVNAVMAANPIGLVIAAIATLITLVVTAYRQSETFRTVVQTAGRIAAVAFASIIGPIRDVIGWIGDAVEWLRDNVPAAARTARDVAVGAWNAIVAPIRTAIAWIRDAADALGINSALAAAFRTIRAVGSAAFEWIGSIIDGVRSAVNAVRIAIDYAVSRLRVLQAGVRAVGDTGIGGPIGNVFRPFMGRGLSAPAPAPTYVVNVSGALDPDAVARQIDSLLSTRAARVNR